MECAGPWRLRLSVQRARPSRQERRARFPESTPTVVHVNTPRCRGESVWCAACRCACEDGRDTCTDRHASEIITLQAGQCGNSGESRNSTVPHGAPVLALMTTCTTSRIAVLAAAVSRARHQPRRQPRGLCDRRRRPQRCLLLPVRRHALHPSRHPPRPRAASHQRHPDGALQEHLQPRELLRAQGGHGRRQQLGCRLRYGRTSLG